MADQTIPGSGGDKVKGAVSSSWSKGDCPPEWAEPTVLQFSGGSVLQFSDDAVLAFTEY